MDTYEKLFKKYYKGVLDIKIVKNVPTNKEPFLFRGKYRYVDDYGEKENKYRYLELAISLEDRSLLNKSGKSKVDIFYNQIKYDEVLASNIKDMLNNIEKIGKIKEYNIRKLKTFVEIGIFFYVIPPSNKEYFKKFNDFKESLQ